MRGIADDNEAAVWVPPTVETVVMLQLPLVDAIDEVEEAMQQRVPALRHQLAHHRCRRTSNSARISVRSPDCRCTPGGRSSGTSSTTLN